MATNGVRIAILAAKAIGDGGISLILANNLARNGFEVTFYSNPFSQLKDWLPWALCKPQPSKDACASELAPYDLVLADNGSILGPANWPESEWASLSAKYLYLGLERLPESFKRDHRERLKASLPEEKFKTLEKIASYSGDIRHQHGDRHMSMVKCAATLAKETWGLSNVVDSAGLQPPAALNLIPCKASRRIMLHPYSGLDRKNWPLEKYIALAKSLRRDGWEPEFCCAASERDGLIASTKGEFPVPPCANLSEFAARIYESFALVGNDSGPVHLASCLGVRTLSISLRGRMHRWRPDWRPGVIVLPPLKIKFSSSKILWKPFTPVWHVRKGFDTLLALGDGVPSVSCYV